MPHGQQASASSGSWWAVTGSRCSDPLPPTTMVVPELSISSMQAHPTLGDPSHPMASGPLWVFFHSYGFSLCRQGPSAHALGLCDGHTAQIHCWKGHEAQPMGPSPPKDHP